MTSVVVFDNGSGAIKAGLAGDRAPKVVVPSVTSPSTPGPIQRGYVKDWNGLEKLWQQTYERLAVNPKDHPILLTHAPLTSESDREKMLEIIFEKFQVPSMSLGIQAVLALYAAGQMGGFVLDSGYGMTHIVPCDQGFDIPANDLHVNLAGNDLTLYLTKLLNESGYGFKSDSVEDMKLVQEIKEKLCYVASDSTESAPSEYKLHDGRVINLGKERTQCTEALFNPSLVGIDSPGVHQLIHDSIQKCSKDLQSRMYGTLILTGGNTMFAGMKERLEKEIRQLAPQGTNVEVIASPVREHSVWIGGSILGALPTFLDLLITKQAYQESGSAIVHKIE